jgi:hypothetical protein
MGESKSMIQVCNGGHVKHEKVFHDVLVGRNNLQPPKELPRPQVPSSQRNIHKRRTVQEKARRQAEDLRFQRGTSASLVCPSEGQEGILQIRARSKVRGEAVLERRWDQSGKRTIFRSILPFPEQITSFLTEIGDRIMNGVLS